MSTRSVGSRLEACTAAWLISAGGVLSCAIFVGWTYWFRADLEAAAVGLGFATIVGPALGLVWAGHRLVRSGIEPERYDRILRWCVGGAVGFLAVNVAVMSIYPWVSTAGNVAWAHFSVNAGAIAGFAVGYVEARAIQRAVEATAATVRAERLAEERALLSYLNDLLRHEVLNSAQIIGGHASLARERVGADDPDAMRSHLETIDRESDALTGVIGEVRAMLDANRDAEQTGVVDLHDVLTAEIDALEHRFDGVTVEREIPEAVRASGNEGVSWIFANVLENAVEHDPSSTTRLEVTVDPDATAETVTVTIADDGPGIPPEKRGTLFERKSENHGLGLYLAHILAKRYDGTIELTETGSDGSVFTVTLSQPADRNEDDRAGKRRPAAVTRRARLSRERTSDSRLESADPTEST
ncbi:ATP-binding protein [Natronolimnohabitans innermongolicus]|uniref:histidine kinase n=1 Tax=Natronolimnohabitans innermongolicus JCM 12255 TaxID=1227499 RepID=L9X4W3_9EURY|nr:ATP-binding protein [Natronolimnohabitans innermongolicus]ELY56657.1 integral membrane sensor signal transduction histidine kinase [Natronolimnohabitans innermongolicus JCM 12255]